MLLEFDTIDWEHTISGQLRYSIIFGRSRPEGQRPNTIEEIRKDFEDKTYSFFHVDHENEVTQYVRSMFSEEVVKLLKCDYMSKELAEMGKDRVIEMYLELNN
ncbi:hypothetical protein [Xanthovirga aplysinae]|uniref:hypothetical protein n=1 Tax=Xanthovirga aplysinae TaxID=2529853 RepID=UPI0012BB9B7E|nr:hypothetical protein [Xanthovirga aplysinae]MTI33291.1 hypothetical protein [Xanthovirga aplysinae]